MSTAAESGMMTSYFNLKTISIVLVLGMLLVSGYLSYSELTESEVACVESGSFNCNAVQNSVYSEVMGIKVAYLGFGVNLVILGLLLLEDRIAFLQENGLTLLFGIVFFGFLYSVYLVYIQAAVLDSYCQWCLSHEVLITLLFVVTGLRLYREFTEAEPE